MSTQAITSVFNDGIIAEQFERYRQDPASVDETWRQYFRVAESLFANGAMEGDARSAAPSASSGAASSTPPNAAMHSAGATPEAAAPTANGIPDIALLRKVASIASLQQAIRNYGHLAVQLDPLGTPPPGAAELSLEFHHLTEADLQAIPGAAIGDERFATAAEVISRKREVYSGRVGYEVWHLGSDEERNWFRTAFREGQLTRDLTPDEKKAMLARLNDVDALERFLGKTYQGAKRFSIEGTDTLVPMLDEIISEAGTHGAREVVVGMAHRGRLNVLTNVMGKPFETLFGEFQGIHEHTDDSATGDVKYHMGFEGSRTVDGKSVRTRLVPNPSHLEVVNPVIEGVTRALQRVPGKIGERDEGTVVPVAIHGDAAFPGEGIVTETLNLSQLNAYRTGGTIHIIVNNQVGFTTDPNDARSTRYASDPAKGYEIPVMHVNADDAGACIIATRIACAYREHFGKDVLIDLVGYRRHGHNETDEPSFTQPTRYTTIRAHPTVPQAWGARLVEDGTLTADDVSRMERDAYEKYTGIHTRFKQSLLAKERHAPWPPAPPTPPAPVQTAVAAERLQFINESLLAWPSSLAPNPKLTNILQRRREAMGEAGGIEWGHAEALAFGSLLLDGKSVRLTGQDAERGTFSHRHAVLNDASTGAKYAPLANLNGAKGTFEVYNSALSETAVLAFEYGYSTVATDAVVLWEAQFGDFVNVAQPIIDQFITADRAKWGTDSAIVMLLPHGYEGQGPEHSSARLERFLQLAAEGNMSVVYCSTPAQYFHVLRRQAMRRNRRPLVVMQPKSLLRLPLAASKLSDLTAGGFQPVIDDPVASQHRDDVKRMVFCTGKLYYDMASSPKRDNSVALVRVEELYPWPRNEINAVMDRYPAIEEVVWAQEEPRNQGAWTYAQPRLRASAGARVGVRYIGRPDRAAPAEGYADDHKKAQEEIVSLALTTDASETPGAPPPQQAATVNG